MFLSLWLHCDRCVIVPSNVTDLFDDEALVCGEFFHFWTSYAETKAIFLVSVILNIHTTY